MLNWLMEQMQLNKEDYEGFNCSYIEDSTQIPQQKVNQFFNHLLGSENLQHGISFAPNATSIIQTLFNKYVDDDTLVISTQHEHPSVKECLDRCKNVIKLNLFNFSISQVTNYIKNYKKLFIYIIGVSNTAPIYTPNYIFKSISSIQMPKILVLDDCQGMFLFPRDYSMFDYVIGTMHSIVPQYDTGILLQRQNNSVGLQNLENILKAVRPVLKKLPLLAQFSTIMDDHFSYLKNNPQFRLSSLSHHFVIEDVFKQTGRWEQGKHKVFDVQHDGAPNKAIFRATYACCLPNNFREYLYTYESMLQEII